MNYYEMKRQLRIERMRERAAKKAAFARENDLSLFGEAKSGIPMGQPILVGHHSEKRHRRHLERIENRVRKGYEAGEQAQRLEERAAAAESRTAIDSDNPDAVDLIKAKIERLEKKRARYKMINAAIRKTKDVKELAEIFRKEIPEEKDPEKVAAELLKPDCFGKLGVPNFLLTNVGAEIRRLQKRLPQLEVIQQGFEPFEVNGILVELIDGQIHLGFPWKPCEESRARIKSLAFKWSRFSGRWVRKHTATTAGQYFKQNLEEALKAAKAEKNEIHP